MNCETARDRLLEADLTKLRGDGELAQHLHACSACQDRARGILAQYAALQGELERAVPRFEVAQPRRRPAAPRTPRWRWTVVAPLALAASLAVLLLSRRRELPQPVTPSVQQVASAAAPLDVEVLPGRAVTVFQTDNPNIVVIWSF